MWAYWQRAVGDAPTTLHMTTDCDRPVAPVRSCTLYHRGTVCSPFVAVYRPSKPTATRFGCPESLAYSSPSLPGLRALTCLPFSCRRFKCTLCAIPGRETCWWPCPCAAATRPCLRSRMLWATSRTMCPSARGWKGTRPRATSFNSNKRSLPAHGRTATSRSQRCVSASWETPTSRWPRARTTQPTVGVRRCAKWRSRSRAETGQSRITTLSS